MNNQIKRFYVTERIQEICSESLGQLYNIDLVAAASYIFRVCKIEEMLTRDDKRNKTNLQIHLEKFRKQIIPVLNDLEVQQSIINAIVKARIFSHSMHTNADATHQH